MNFIDRSAEIIAKSIRNNYSEAGSEVALKYALSLLINSFTSITIAILFSASIGRLTECIVGITAYTVLRFFAGGLHTTSSLACCVLSIFIFITISFFRFEYGSVFLFLDLISIGILVRTAPKDIENVSSFNPKYYPLLKITAIVIVGSNLIINSSLLSVAFFIQAFLTTDFAYQIRDNLERGK